MSTWWIHEPFVLGSANPTDEELEELRTRGFTVLVTLLDENEQSPRYDSNTPQALGYVQYSIPIRDFHAPSTAQLFEFTKLMESLPPDSKLLIRCEGGTGRTGTMAAAYWIAKGVTPDTAIERVRKARRGAIETPEQEAVLRVFASQLQNARRGTNSD